MSSIKKLIETRIQKEIEYEANAITSAALPLDEYRRRQAKIEAFYDAKKILEDVFTNFEDNDEELDE